jgi:putative oxidoreductase
MCNMIGAIALVHGSQGLFMNWTGNQGGEGFEYHLLALAAGFAILMKGSGALSLDLPLSRPRRARVTGFGRDRAA